METIYKTEIYSALPPFLLGQGSSRGQDQDKSEYELDVLFQDDAKKSKTGPWIPCFQRSSETPSMQKRPPLRYAPKALNF
jgi:hypothetical protein